MITNSFITMPKCKTILQRAIIQVPWVMLLIGAVISLLPLFALSLFAFPSADDFCYAVAARNGFWQAQVSYYSEWCGRYTATFLFSTLGLFDLSRIYPWFSLVTLLATLAAFRFFIGAILTKHISTIQFWVAGGVAMAVFVGNLPSTVEAFFWMASTITYQWSIITFLIWLTLLIRIVRDVDSGTAKLGVRIAATILTILLPGFNEVFVPIILVTLAVFVATCLWYTRNADRFILTLLGIAILLSMVMVFSPGNSVRSASYPSHATRHNLEFSLMETARKSWRFFTIYLSYLPLWAAAVAAWLWGPRLTPKTKTVPKSIGCVLAWICAMAFGVYITLFPLNWEYYGFETETSLLGRYKAGS